VNESNARDIRVLGGQPGIPSEAIDHEERLIARFQNCAAITAWSSK